MLSIFNKSKKRKLSYSAFKKKINEYHYKHNNIETGKY